MLRSLGRTRSLGRRRAAGAPAPWSPALMGDALGGYFTGSRAVGSPVSAIPDPFSGNRIGVAQATPANQPAIAAGVMTFNGASTQLRPPPPPLTGSTAAATSTQPVPDGSGEDPGRGFTCTGLAIDTAGNLWLGNDGRRRGGSIFAASVVRTNAAGTVKLAEHTLASLGLPTDSSVQGVAFIPASATGGANELWFARTAGATRQVHRIDADTGALLANPWGGAAFTALNGLTYDSDLDALIVGDNTSTARWFARTAPDTASPLRTMALSLVPDQLHYDAARKWVWCTGGPNGSDGLLRARNALNSPNADHLQMTVAGCRSIEGVATTPAGLIVVNDDYFHGALTDINELRFHPYPAGLPAGSQAYPTGDRVQFFGLARVPATPASAQCLIGVGGADPSSGTATGAAGFYASNTAGRLAVFQNAASAVWNGFTLTSEFLFYVDINLAADTAELWFNGVSAGSVAFSASPALNTITRGLFSIGNGPGGSRFFAGEMRAAGFSLGAAGLAERLRMEGFLCHDQGQAALLPAGHPHKNAPP